MLSRNLNICGGYDSFFCSSLDFRPKFEHLRTLWPLFLLIMCFWGTTDQRAQTNFLPRGPKVLSAPLAGRYAIYFPDDMWLLRDIFIGSWIFLMFFVTFSSVLEQADLSEMEGVISSNPTWKCLQMPFFTVLWIYLPAKIFIIDRDHDTTDQRWVGSEPSESISVLQSLPFLLCSLQLNKKSSFYSDLLVNV